MKKIGIIGGTGYTGGELARILCTHPDVELVSMTSRRSAGSKVSDLNPGLKGYVDLEFTEKVSDDADLVFVAAPHGASMKIVPELMDTGVKIVDLSGDYRFKDVSVYEKWYGFEHTDKDNIPEAVYGLPEFYRDEIKKAKLVANPGCYATSAILAIAPIIGLTDGNVFVDGKSGTSGAGMTPNQRLHHPTCGESVIPYSAGAHRHSPEIQEIVNDVSGKNPGIMFVPHLVPIVRGIISSCYFRLNEGVTQEDADKAYSEAYGKEFFVRYVKNPSIRAVVGSNHAEVSCVCKDGNAVSFGVLDNLMKGASGQAVQCMNLMLGFKETDGLKIPGLGV
jgi:N-acetyl-gamma-glutamyl-phosphate reductase